MDDYLSVHNQKEAIYVEQRITNKLSTVTTRHQIVITLNHNTEVMSYYFDG